jgi:hypothetical protein
VNLPEPYTPSAATRRAIAERNAALAADPIMLPNKFRLGDTVGLLTLCAWIEREYGPKTFFCQHYPATLDTLLSFYPDHSFIAPAIEAPAEVVELDTDKPSLWRWQSYFQHIGFRLVFHTDKEPEYDIVYAPLLDADYDRQRILHPTFAVELALALEARYPGRVLILSHDWGYHDRKLFADAAVAYNVPSRIAPRLEGLNVQELPLKAAIEHIGSCKVFIGNDTGLSHVAGAFPNVKQCALYSADLTALHAARDKGTEGREHSEMLEALTGFYGHFDSTPNKHPDNIKVIQFYHGGYDGFTLNETLQQVEKWL